MGAGAYTIADDPRDPRNFFMNPVADQVVPDDQQLLNIAIQKVLNAVDLLYPAGSTPQLNTAFSAVRGELMGIARVGLTGTQAQTGLAARALESLKDDVLLRETGRVKNQYMRRLGFIALLMAGVALWVFLLATLAVPPVAAYLHPGPEKARRAFVARAQKFQRETSQGTDQAKALGGKAGELITAVGTVDENAGALLAKANEFEQAAQADTKDKPPLRDEARHLADQAREFGAMQPPGGAGVPWAKTTSCFAVLWLGCMGGVWLSFGYRKTLFRFEDLVVLEADRLEPTVRLIFAGIMTVLIGLFFYEKVITIVVGEVSTAQIADDPMIALILGAVCGFSELVLGTKVAQRAAAFLDWK